mgnify:CR=1 FL=1
MLRSVTIGRKTNETEIQLKLTLEGGGNADIKTGCGFLNHMLELFARHGRFDLSVSCKGDTAVDDHHTVEDVGIALGQAFYQAMGDMKGVTRYGSILLPMDEALVMVAVDLSGRAHLSYDVTLPSQKVGEFDTELAKEFFLGFVREARITLHLRQLAGENTHHILEAAFKGFGRVMRQAVAIDRLAPDEIPSTKGTLGGRT